MGANYLQICCMRGATVMTLFSTGEARIVRHARTDRQKVVFAQNPRADNNTSSILYTQTPVGVWWTSDSAITSIALLASIGDFAIGSIFAPDGIL